ncbi:hypothetical protein KCP78_16500 [Salmonella enterica subsp. enterica]|nr:hypothetical protein KCP78_16500 [Salmonella enterica subsp. enterica]
MKSDQVLLYIDQPRLPCALGVKRKLMQLPYRVPAQENARGRVAAIASAYMGDVPGRSTKRTMSSADCTGINWLKPSDARSRLNRSERTNTARLRRRISDAPRLCRRIYYPRSTAAARVKRTSLYAQAYMKYDCRKGASGISRENHAAWQQPGIKRYRR